MVGGASIYPFAWSILLAAHGAGPRRGHDHHARPREDEVRDLLGVPPGVGRGRGLGAGLPSRREPSHPAAPLAGRALRHPRPLRRATAHRLTHGSPRRWPAQDLRRTLRRALTVRHRSEKDRHPPARFLCRNPHPSKPWRTTEKEIATRWPAFSVAIPTLPNRGTRQRKGSPPAGPLSLSYRGCVESAGQARQAKLVRTTGPPGQPGSARCPARRRRGRRPSCSSCRRRSGGRRSR